MKIGIITMAYNEEKMLPYFLRHYEYVDEIRVLYETDSTDNTLNILERAKNVGIHPIHIEGGIVDETKVKLINMEIAAMKDFDWLYILDPDEFIYPDNHEDPREFLARQTEDIIYAHMWQVYRHWTEKDLDPYDYPLPQRQHGDPDLYNQTEGQYQDKNANSIKPIVIRQSACVNFNPGNHQFTGKHIISMDLYRGTHWQNADPKISIERRLLRKARISKRNRELRHGFQHFDVTEEKILEICNAHSNDPKLPIYNIPDMSFLKFLSFESNDQCNLTNTHLECPSNDPTRYKNTDQHLNLLDIIEFTELCMKHGFDGLLTLHYYNEPMLTPGIVATIAREFPDRVSLWTNGALLNYEKHLGIIQLCHDVMITKYPYIKYDERILALPNVRTQEANLDGRIKEIIKPVYSPHHKRCGRPNWELIIDYHGFGHMCCGDWRGEIEIGNILTDDPHLFLHRWNYHRENINVMQPWDEGTFTDLPFICQECLTRSPIISKAGL